MTLAELTERLDHTLGIKISLARCCRVLKELGLPRKKMLHASEQDSERVTQARVIYR